MTYCIQAIAMGNDLGLFGQLEAVDDRKQRDSYGFTAWTLFFWTSYDMHRNLRTGKC